MALLLRRQGISKVRPLEGGLDSWRQRGFPMKSTGAEPVALERQAQEA